MRHGLGRAALHLDQAHAAIAGDRQPLVKTEARHFRTGLLTRLQQRVVVRHFDLVSINLDLGHASSPVFAGGHWGRAPSLEGT
jgi:hypothetical protein